MNAPLTRKRRQDGIEMARRRLTDKLSPEAEVQPLITAEEAAE
jgi:hypothetical protein